MGPPSKVEKHKAKGKLTVRKRIDLLKDKESLFIEFSELAAYEVYDDYFCLEKFNVAIKNLKDKGFDVIDTRRELKHDISALSKETGDYSTTPISVIKDMKRDGYVPTVKSLYSAATYGIIENVYKEDIDLYSVQIGEQNILRL